MFDVGYSIEESIGQYLKPPPQGMYLNGSPTPLFERGKRYYQSINGEMVPLDQCQWINGNVFDEDMKLVYRYKSTDHFSDRPLVPTTGADIAFDLLTSTVNRQLSWRPFDKSFHAKLDKYLNDGCETTTVVMIPNHEFKFGSGSLFAIEENRDSTIPVMCEERIRMVMQPITEQIFSFIGNQTWLSYNITRNHYDVSIERGVDYRIQEWTRLVDEGKIDRFGSIRK